MAIVHSTTPVVEFASEFLVVRPRTMISCGAKTLKWKHILATKKWNKAWRKPAWLGFISNWFPVSSWPTICVQNGVRSSLARRLTVFAFTPTCHKCSVPSCSHLWSPSEDFWTSVGFPIVRVWNAGRLKFFYFCGPWKFYNLLWCFFLFLQCHLMWFWPCIFFSFIIEFLL